MPVPGLVHRYPDRVLFLVTDRCATYCRYLHPQPRGERSGRTGTAHRFRRGVPLSRSTHRGARRAALAAATRCCFRDRSWSTSSAGCAPSRTSNSSASAAHADLPAAAHHAGALRDAAEVPPALDEHPCQPPARIHDRSAGRARATGQPRRPAGQPERAARRRQRRRRDDEERSCTNSSSAACARTTSTSAT